MKVELLTATPLEIALEAGLICTDNEDKISQYDANKFISKLLEQGHESVIEHINYSFRIEGISRAMLQELARHRHISLSVKSTRWALKKIKDKIEFYNPNNTENTYSKEYIDIIMDLDSKIEELKNLIKNGVDAGIPNDILKYYIPESLTTKLMLTLNARELRHIFELRTSKRALNEFRRFCAILYLSLPKEHRFIYDSVLALSDDDIKLFNIVNK